ncbi:MAG: ORF6N domain-containing protein [Patescibacteria group bacterium]
MEKENKELHFQRGRADEIIKQRIFIIRGHKVMIDVDLAELYGVATKVFNQAIKRNQERFPGDFMFRLSQEEYDELNRSQIVTGSQKHRDPRFTPYAFTEHGVAMLSAVLKSEQAVQMSIFIVRAFIKMRESLESYKDLALKIGEIEVTQIHDHATLRNVHDVVKHLLSKPTPFQKKPGFDLEL